MNYIVFGSAGGLGSFLVDQLTKTYKTVGIDILASKTTHYVIDPNCAKNIKSTVEEILDNTDAPYCVILCIANRSRIRGSFEIDDRFQSDIGKDLINEPKILMNLANSLSKHSIKASEESHIIYIGSVLSRKIVPSESPIYGASKAASIQLLKWLASDLLVHNICVNSISPALMARNSDIKKVLLDNLRDIGDSYGITSYSDVLKLIEFIAMSETPQDPN